MKFFVSFLFFTFFIMYCSNQVTNSEVSNNQVSFFTDRQSYSENDTIIVTIDNESDSTLMIGLRCGGTLEMFYQKMENNNWSDNMYFYYMTLRCPTIMDSVLSNEKFSQPFLSSIFDSSGTYRLVLNETIFSNSFTIN